MHVTSFGTEEEKIGLGFEMFNISGKSELSFKDFNICYQSVVSNWSLLLGEKLSTSDEFVREIFNKLDNNYKGSINKKEYYIT